MANLPRRIGILTGGGDCPGLNAVLRAVTKDAIFHGIEVVGIEDGFLGLIEDRARPLGYQDVSDILTVGGTILGTSNRADPRRFEVGRDADGRPVFEDVTARALAHATERGLEALVVIGGDGHVKKTSTRGSFRDPKVLECMRREAKRLKFPKPKGGNVPVVKTYSFRPED